MSIGDFVDGLDFDNLIRIADVLGIVHETYQWFDDDYPDKIDELQVKVAEAIENF